MKNRAPDHAPAPATAGAPGATTAPRAGSRGGNIALWVLQVITALLFVNGGVIKLIGTEQSVEAFALFGLGDWFMYAIGAVELLGGVALLIPRLAGPAALGFVVMMIGAVISELTVLKAGFVIAPLGALTAVAIIAWARRRSTAEFAALVRGRGRG